VGECFLIANIDKRQYLSAGSMNENPKRRGFLRSLHGRALGLLVCRSSDVGHGYGELAGSWYGDRIIAVGDQNAMPDAHGITTSTAERPNRTLYDVVSETYEDISLAAVAMLCRGDERVVEDLIEAAVADGSRAMRLVGDVVFVAGSSELDEAMRKRLGKEWVGRYRRMCGSGSQGQ
jgi:hypothetical protein